MRGCTQPEINKYRFYILMTSITDFQKHWLSTRCIYDDKERQFVPEKLRKYITPGKYLPDGFTFLKSIIPYFDRRNYYVNSNVAFYLLTNTPTRDDITKVFDKCNAYGIPLYDVSFTLEDLCTLTMQCRKNPGYYEYDSDEDYGHNSYGRSSGAQFIYALYNTTALSPNRTSLSTNHVFNALRFIFTHEDVFNNRYMHHCYQIASLKKDFFSKKQWLRLTKAFNAWDQKYDEGEQDLSTDPYEDRYCSDCDSYGHPSWMCHN